MQQEERREKEFRSGAKPFAAIVENHLWVEADRPDCECKPAQNLIHHVPSLCVPSWSVSHLFFVGFLTLILNLIHFLLHKSLPSWTAKGSTSQPDSNRNLSADPLRELSSEERELQTSLATTKDNKTVTTLSSLRRPHSLNSPTPSRHVFLRIRHSCVIPPPSSALFSLSSSSFFFCFFLLDCTFEVTFPIESQTVVGSAPDEFHLSFLYLRIAKWICFCLVAISSSQRPLRNPKPKKSLNLCFGRAAG